jgi:hypothetical protein
VIQATKALFRVALTGSLADIYVPPTQPPNLQGVICSLWVTNISGGAVTATLRWGSGTLTSANALMEGKSVPANDYIFETSGDEGAVIIIAAGSHLQGLCSSSGNIIVSGFGREIS